MISKILQRLAPCGPFKVFNKQCIGIIDICSVWTATSRFVSKNGILTRLFFGCLNFCPFFHCKQWRSGDFQTFPRFHEAHHMNIVGKNQSNTYMERHKLFLPEYFYHSLRIIRDNVVHQVSKVKLAPSNGIQMQYC